jgi:hypothetical protein
MLLEGKLRRIRGAPQKQRCRTIGGIFVYKKNEIAPPLLAVPPAPDGQEIGSRIHVSMVPKPAVFGMKQ